MVRETVLNSVPEVESVLCDGAAMVTIRMKKDKAVDEKVVTEAFLPKKLTVKNFKKELRDKPVGTHVVGLSGMT